MITLHCFSARVPHSCVTLISRRLRLVTTNYANLLFKVMFGFKPRAQQAQVAQFGKDARGAVSTGRGGKAGPFLET